MSRMTFSHIIPTRRLACSSCSDLNTIMQLIHSTLNERTEQIRTKCHSLNHSLSKMDRGINTTAVDITQTVAAVNREELPRISEQNAMSVARLATRCPGGWLRAELMQIRDITLASSHQVVTIPVRGPGCRVPRPRGTSPPLIGLSRLSTNHACHDARLESAVRLR